jgi:ferrochelatase
MNAVLLLAHGAPESLEEVEPFLERIRKGRPTAPTVVAEVRRRYALIGGRSPLPAIVRRQAALLQARLGDLARVFWAMRHTPPFIAEVALAARAAGARRILAIPLAPQASALTTGAYARALEEALGEPAAIAPSFCDHPLLAQAFAQRIREAVATLPPDARPTLLFTTHSLPLRLLSSGDPYPDEFRRTVAAIVACVAKLAAGHRLAYQSQGMTEEAWLGPTVPEALKALRAEKRTDVLLVPVGFLVDNVEILYDVDVDFQAQARSMGVRLWRTEALNDLPRFVDLLESLAREGLT